MEPITPIASKKYFELMGLKNNLWTDVDNLDQIVSTVKITSTPKPLFEKFEPQSE